MRTLIGFAAVAALALSTPINAKPGGSHGGGNPHGGGGNPNGGGGKAHGGGGNPHFGGGPGGGRQARGGGNPHFGGGGPVVMPHRGGHERGPAFGAGTGRARGFAEHGRGRAMKAERRAERQVRRIERRAERPVLVREERRLRGSAPLPAPAGAQPWPDRRGAGRSCPPGLAMKGNGCLPPGQAKKIFRIGEAFPAAYFGAAALPLGYRDFYPENPDYAYRYDDSGYIYRVDRQSDLVSGLIPLLGGGFGVGELLPTGYDAYNLPLQYRDLYYDTPEAHYRYGDDAIYQVDPQSGMIESIVALLAGGNLGIGQALPAGFDAYNLPLQYRDDYQDGDDAIYRYADGNIYQADPKTQIIEQIISAIA